MPPPSIKGKVRDPAVLQREVKWENNVDAKRGQTCQWINSQVKTRWQSQWGICQATNRKADAPFKVWHPRLVYVYTCMWCEIRGKFLRPKRWRWAECCEFAPNKNIDLACDFVINCVLQKNERKATNRNPFCGRKTGKHFLTLKLLLLDYEFL
jgi:hypothetical protein